MNIFRRELLGRRGVVAFLALALTQWACTEVTDPEPTVEDAAVANSSSCTEDANAPECTSQDECTDGQESCDEVVGEGAPDPDDPFVFTVDYGVNVAHQPLCTGNSYAVVEGTVEGPLDALPSTGAALQLYLDANGNFVYDEGEETGDPFSGEIGADGSFAVGAPLQQYGGHGIMFLVIGGIDVTEQAKATGIFTVDDNEGRTAGLTIDVTFDEAAPIVDTSAFATCP